MAKPTPPAVCPVCGNDVPRKALACPDCGADHNSGWREGSEYEDGLDLPDESFDYARFVRREFGGRASSMKPEGMKTIWWVTGIVVIVVSVVLFLLSLRWN